MFAADPTSSDDSIKLLFVLLVGGLFVLLARWGSRSATIAPGQPQSADSKQQPEQPSPRAWGPSAEEIAASFPFDPLLGGIRIKKFFFEKVDAIPGPADPDVFADELHVQLYDPDTGHSWWQSYFVATPKGFARILQDKSWRYLYAPEVLVVPRYDLEEVRRAVVSRIVAGHEFFKDKETPQEETL